MAPERDNDEDRASHFEVARLAISRLNLKLSDELLQGLEQVAKTSAHALGVWRVGVWFMSSEIGKGDGLYCATKYDRPDDAFSTGPTLAVAEIPSYAQSIHERRVVSVPNVSQDPRTRELLPGYLGANGIMALMDAPIFNQGQVVGVVCHEEREVRAWTKREQDFAASVADMVSTLLAQSARLAAEEERRRSDFRLANVSRMEALGQLAAGVAHDFNNVLLAINLEAERLARGDESADRARQRALEISRHAERGARLVRQLLSFAAPRGLGVGASANVRDVLIDMMPLLTSLLSGLWSADTSLGDERELIAPIERDKFEQVVMNLVSNARDAMPAGGTINLSLALEGQDIVFRVRDAGVGMPQSVRERMLEPFFTTKPPGSGTGLGLSIVHRIVVDAGGAIEVNTAEGAGTTVTVRLPNRSP